MTTVAVVLCFVGLLFIVISVPLARGQVKPNRWYGVRTPATLRDADLWYAANRYGGQLLIVAGALILLAGLLGLAFPPARFSLMFFAPSLAVVICIALIIRKLVLLQRKP